MKEPISACLFRKLQFILKRIKSKKISEVFLNPVDNETVPSYYEFIKEPMDLNTIEDKLNNGKYKMVVFLMKKYLLKENYIAATPSHFFCNIIFILLKKIKF